MGSAVKCTMTEWSACTLMQEIARRRILASPTYPKCLHLPTKGLCLAGPPFPRMTALVRLSPLLSGRLCLHIVHDCSASEHIPLRPANTCELRRESCHCRDHQAGSSLGFSEHGGSCRATLGAIRTLKDMTEKRIWHFALS